jgi:xanthine dehydrogenase YagS FAD-binding subunit
VTWHIGIDEPRPFELLQPASVVQAIELGLKHGRDAAYLAGGCDLIEQLKHQWSNYHYVINLKSVEELRGVLKGLDSIWFGPLTTLGEIERDGDLRLRIPALHKAAMRVATPQIRNMGTLGGNLLQDSRCFYYRGPWYCYRAGGIVCDAHHGVNSEHAIFGGHRCYTVSPSDTATALVALDATCTVQNANGARRMGVAELYVSPDENIRVMHRLGPGDILTGVEVQAPAQRRSTFIKYAQRNAWDFAIASVAVALDREGDQARNVRIVLGAVAPIPWRSFATERAIEGRQLTADSIETASRAATEGAEALAWNEYKIPLVRKLVRAALTELSI